MPAAFVAWVGVCGAGVVGAGIAPDAARVTRAPAAQPPTTRQPSDDGSPPLCHLHTLDARSIEVGLVEITERGVVRYDLNGVEGSIALDDVMALAPAAGGRTSASTLPSNALVFYLADGGVLRGALLDPDKAAPRLLLVDLGQGHVARISFGSLSGIRTRQAKIAIVEKTFQRRLASRRAGRDTLVLARKGKAVVVPGSLESLTPEGWTFRLGGRTRSAGLDEAYGFVLGAQLVAPKVLPARVVLRNRNRFTARILSADRGALHLDAGLLGNMTLPWEMIRRLDLRSERVVYLSDLTPSRVKQHTLLGTSWPMMPDRNVTGGPIRLGGKTYAKGLGVHAFTSLSYELGGAYERFSAVVGVDDSMAPNGSVVFRVKLDDRLVFDSSDRAQGRKQDRNTTQEENKASPARSASEARDNILRGGGIPRSVSVDVRGGHRLTLECDSADELDLSDHGDWAGAILIRSRSKASAKTSPARSAREGMHGNLREGAP